MGSALPSGATARLLARPGPCLGDLPALRVVPVSDRKLLLEIEFPGFYVEGDESDEDIEEAMTLQSDYVVVVFSAFEGEHRVLQHLEGRIRRFTLSPAGGTKEGS